MISVALAAYNGEKYIEQQLESLRLQTVTPDEVIICDDCSTDRTAEICRSFIERNGLSGWSVEINGENMGYCRNFYGAVEKTHGDIIFLCDQDDIWDENKLEVMTDILSEHPELEMLSCRYRLADGEGNISDALSVPHYKADFSGSLETVTAESLIGHSYIRGCASCFRKTVKERIKPIELSNLLGHDWQIAMLSALGGGAAIINLPLMSYRCHSANASFSANPIRKREKRIKGLEESAAGHTAVLPYVKDGALAKKISGFISFEKRRIKLLQGRNLLLWLALGFNIRQYRRYYAGNGLRVWFGDLAYIFK